jgi:hypothetical protein
MVARRRRPPERGTCHVPARSWCAAVVALIGWTLVEALILALLRVFDRRTVTEI